VRDYRSAVDWRTWPKVSPAKSGAANTRGYRRVLVFDLGHASGRPIALAHGGYMYRGPLREAVRFENASFQPYRDSVFQDPAEREGGCVVGLVVSRNGYDRVHRRYVINGSGRPVFYGNPWTCSDVCPV
jgi:hypothetical protein